MSTPSGRPGLDGGLIVRVGAAVAVRPRLWAPAVRQVGRLTPRGWWRRSPRSPFPPPDYLAFRSITQYGDADARPTVADILRWLAWTRDFPR